MNGKHVVITGATAGIGRSAALALAQQGAELTLLCRNPQKAEQVADEIEAAAGLKPSIVAMDMAQLSSVRSAAAELVKHGRTIDVLLNNAGVVNTKRKVTPDGFEEMLAVNHFAPFVLTGELLPLLQQSEAGRIVNVASDAHSFVRSMGFDDMQAQRNFRMFREYGRSKLANILFSNELAARLGRGKLTVNSLHPGVVATSLGTQNDTIFSRIIPAVTKPFFSSPEKGARTSIYLCSSDEVKGITGEYFVNCRQRKPRPWARDTKAAKQLWRYTEKTLSYQFPV